MNTFRATSRCGRCAGALTEADATLTPEGEVVCASCARSLQLRELDKEEEFRPNGALLRVHAAMERADRRLHRTGEWMTASALIVVGIVMSLVGVRGIFEDFSWGVLVVALLGALAIWLGVSKIREL